MKWSRIWSWAMSHGRKAPVRRASECVLLAVELLEDRLVPSTASDPAYDLWRQETFRVDDVAVANIPAADVSAQATPVNSSFGSLIGLPSAFSNTSYRGTGYSVAVIDTGIDYRDTDLGGGFGAGYRVIAGWDFVNNDADPLDDNGHGTHVAGIIGSSSATYSGVAPNVNLIALKVLGADGSGSYGAVEDALKWVIANQAKYNIVAINMSLGSGNYTSNPFTFLEDEFTTLKGQGVFTAVAAGNSFYSFNSQIGIDYPAVSPQVVSVGAVWAGNFGTVAWASGARDETTAADRVTSFTQRGPALSIMAPGALITSTYLNNTYKAMAGTSMASPVVAGAAAILHQAMDAKGLSANQDTILSLMKKTGATVIDGDDENDNVVNTGLSFKRLDLGAALGDIGTATPSNSPPVLQTVPTQTVAPGKSVVVTLNATDANNDPITYSARIVASATSEAIQAQQQLGLYFTGSYLQNCCGLDEKWLKGNGGTWYCILPNGELRVWTTGTTALLQSNSLLTTLDPRYYADPSLLFSASAAAVSSPTLTLVGNKLTIQAPTVDSETYRIEVTASDGKATVAQTFTLNVRNNAPVLQTISNQTVAPGKSINVALSASDADGDTLTFSARVVNSMSASAYQFKQQLGLYYLVSYYEGVSGQGERWMMGTGGKWYAILPNGEFRVWAGTMAATMQSANLLGTFDARFFADPSLLWNAAATTSASPTLSIAGGQLTINAPAGITEGYTIEVSVSDGLATSKRTFALTVQNSKPVLQTISSQSIAPGTSATVSLNATDADGDTLTYSAVVIGSFSGQAYQLDKQVGLYYLGTYYQGVSGQNEKWMMGAGGKWYCVLPNGEFRVWTGTMAGTMQAANLLATFDARYYNDPSLLWNAQPSNAALPTVSISGGQLTINAPMGVTETYRIEVSVSDGMAVAKQSFTASVRTNTAPQIATIATQSMQANSTQTVTLSATDAQGDAVTYLAQIIGTFTNPPASLSLVGNQLTINTAPDYVGSFDIQVIASDGSLSSSTTFRVNVAASAAFSRMQGDVNGDGLKDTVTFNNDGSIWVSIAKAGGGFVNQYWGAWSNSTNWTSVSIGDFNGDGKADIVGYGVGGSIWVGLNTGTTFSAKLWNQWSAASNWGAVLFGDFNGDGKTDILGFATGGSIWVGLSNGSTFATTLWSQWSGASSWSSLTAADIDGDGKRDLVGRNTNGSYYVAYSTGTGFRTALWTEANPPTDKSIA